MKTLSSKLIIASSGVCADLLYASGFHAEDDFVYFETPERKGIIVSPLEYARAVQQAKKGIEVIDYSRIPSHRNLKAGKLPAICFSEYLGIREWLVPEDFPFGTAVEMQKAGIRLDYVKGSFFPEREVKKAKEVRAVRQSVKAVEEIMRMLRDMIRESRVNSSGCLELAGKIVTSEFLRREIEGTFKKMGYTATQTIVACGPDGAAPHNTGSGPIRAGEPIVADIFPRSDETGYWGDMTRTFLKGKAPRRVKAAYDAVKGASEAAFKVLRAGRTGAEVHAVAADFLKSAGYNTGVDKNGLPCGFFHGLGHGVGLEIHEAPRVSPSYPKPLKAGNIVSVEPGLYYSEWGGIRLEDLALVKKDGAEDLNTMEMELEVP